MCKYSLSVALLLATSVAGGRLAIAQTGKGTTPTMYAVSNAHFDTQWNWDVQTSISQYVWNTINQNLFLLDKYPHYIFNFEGGVKYAWMKEYYPESYARLKEYVKQGRWHLTGSSWDATDVNLPSPEAMTRNILYGQQFYMDEFGTRGTDLFYPDCFGFGYTLPTIGAHCGLIGFSTQKLQWRSNPFFGTSKIPFEIGLWQGVDGSRIMLVADAYGYTTRWPDKDLTKDTALFNLTSKKLNKTIYHYYGTGDIGGSPTMESVRAIEKSVAGNGPLKVISAASDQLYKDYQPFSAHPELPVYDGELLMDVHGTGCYTSQAAMKMYNRRNQVLGDAAERAAVAAEWLGAQPYPQAFLNEAWKRFLWHQFHDDLTGTSIPRAYEFSWNDELLSQKQFADVLTTSVGSIASLMNTAVKGTPVVIQNPVAAPVQAVVEIDLGPLTAATLGKSVVAYDQNGKQAPSQIVLKNGKPWLLASVKAPSMATMVYELKTGNSSYKSSLKVSANSLENSIYRLTLNANGDISSLIDKRTNRELVKNGKAIRLALFTNNESTNWPAWEIMKKTVDAAPVSITDNVKISIAVRGALRAALCVERTYGESTFRQYIRLTEGGGTDDRIDFVNEIDWHTENALLKAEFPLSISNEKAVYDLGVGRIARGNNVKTAYEVIAQYWADLSEAGGSYGVAVLNNGKYGWDKPDDNTIRLTLLHTPKPGRGYTYQSRQDLGYHCFTYSIVAHQGDIDQAGIVMKAEQLNAPMEAFATPKHAGALGREFSFASLNTQQVILRAVKKAEKSNEYVVRLYETTGKAAQNVALSFPATVVSAKELNGVEDVIGSAKIESGKLVFDIKPFSIKTFAVTLQPTTVKAQMPVSQPLKLAYNLKTASYNGFRAAANFDGLGNSFAAELLPTTIEAGGVTFTLGESDTENGMTCRGDTIALPATGAYNKLYLLAASTKGNNRDAFRIGNRTDTLIVPYYSGFVGQWEHSGHTVGYLSPARVAFAGTHRHSASDNKDLPYEFTYLYQYELDIPKGAKEIILPTNPRIVIFAASLANNANDELTPLTPLVVTMLKTDRMFADGVARKNLLQGSRVIGQSTEPNGRYSRWSRPEFAFDDNAMTAWMDMGEASPKYIEMDLGKLVPIHGWTTSLVSGRRPNETPAEAFTLQVKANEGDAWQTADAVTDNKEATTKRELDKPVNARYVRLQVNQPDRGARIYEMELY